MPSKHMFELEAAEISAFLMVNAIASSDSVVYFSSFSKRVLYSHRAIPASLLHKLEKMLSMNNGYTVFSMYVSVLLNLTKHKYNKQFIPRTFVNSRVLVTISFTFDTNTTP